eukprot:933579-Prorocentrum_minimum.AAC.1
MESASAPTCQISARQARISQYIRSYPIRSNVASRPNAVQRCQLRAARFEGARGRGRKRSG